MGRGAVSPSIDSLNSIACWCQGDPPATFSISVHSTELLSNDLLSVLSIGRIPSIGCLHKYTQCRAIHWWDTMYLVAPGHNTVVLHFLPCRHLGIQAGWALFCYMALSALLFMCYSTWREGSTNMFVSLVHSCSLLHLYVPVLIVMNKLWCI